MPYGWQYRDKIVWPNIPAGDSKNHFFFFETLSSTIWHMNIGYRPRPHSWGPRAFLDTPEDPWTPLGFRGHPWGPLGTTPRVDALYRGAHAWQRHYRIKRFHHPPALLTHTHTRAT